MNSWLMRSIGGEGQGGRGVNGRGMEKPRGRGEMGSMCIIHLGALRVQTSGGASGREAQGEGGGWRVEGGGWMVEIFI